MPNTYLSRTPASAGNRKIFTFSFWTKISNVTSRMATYNWGNSTGTIGSGDGQIFFNQGSDQSLVVSCGGGVDINVEVHRRDSNNYYLRYCQQTLRCRHTRSGHQPARFRKCCHSRTRFPICQSLLEPNNLGRRRSTRRR